MSGSIAIFEEANKRFTGFEHHIWLSALVGSLTVLVDDEEVWRQAVKTAMEFMETQHKKEAAQV